MCITLTAAEAFYSRSDTALIDTATMRTRELTGFGRLAPGEHRSAYSLTAETEDPFSSSRIMTLGIRSATYYPRWALSGIFCRA